MFRKLIVPAFLVTIAAGGVGCESLGGGGGESDAQKAERRAENRARRERAADRAADRDTVRDGETLRDDSRIERRSSDDNVISTDRSARATRGLDSIPRNADRVDAAAGTSVLDYTAAEDGQIYVYDVTDDRVVWTGELRDGERLIIDPREDTALINGRKISDESLRANFRTGHSYRLYFADGTPRR